MNNAYSSEAEGHRSSRQSTRNNFTDSLADLLARYGKWKRAVDVLVERLKESD